MYLKERLPKFEIETAPAVFTLPHLIAWLETKTPDDSYRWCSRNCLLGQWAKHCGLSTGYLGLFDKLIEIGSYESIVGAAIAVNRPHTFGAALKRARAYYEVRRK
jgi:hypothetical protein